MNVDVKNKTVIVEIPFEEITHVYGDPIGKSLDTGETEIGFGIEAHHKPFVGLRLLIEDENFATLIMQEPANMDNV